MTNLDTISAWQITFWLSLSTLALSLLAASVVEKKRGGVGGGGESPLHENMLTRLFSPHLNQQE